MSTTVSTYDINNSNSLSTTIYTEDSGNTITLNAVSVLSGTELVNDTTTSSDISVLFGNNNGSVNPINESDVTTLTVPQQTVVTEFVGIGKHWRIKADRTNFYFQFNANPTSSTSSWRNIPFVKNVNINTNDIENVVLSDSAEYATTLGLIQGWANKYNRNGLMKAAYTLQYNIYGSESFISYLSSWQSLSYNILVKETAYGSISATNARNRYKIQN